MQERRDNGKFGVKEFILKNKKAIIIGLFALVIVIIIFAFLLNRGANLKQKKLLEDRLSEIAGDFYQNKYYPNITNSTGETSSEEEKKAYLNKYSTSGITFDLDSLARISGKEKDNILEEFSGCDTKDTIAKIIPKEPFTSKDFVVSVELSCSFLKSN